MTKAVGRTSTYGTPHDVQVNHFPNLNVFIQLMTCIPGHCSEDRIKKSKTRDEKQHCRITATTHGDAHSEPW
jgi:hypothetical protein